MTPRVLNQRHGIPPADAVYVGRPGLWGNPFEIGRDGSRAEVIEKYRKLVADDPLRVSRLPALRGRDLVCWCKPLPCHADVLLEMANK